MYILEEKHLEAAKEFAAESRIKKSCKKCFDRGWIGTNQENLLIICPKCVDKEKSFAKWKEYCEGIPELYEHFKESFEEEETQE